MANNLYLKLAGMVLRNFCKNDDPHDRCNYIMGRPDSEDGNFIRFTNGNESTFVIGKCEAVADEYRCNLTVSDKFIADSGFSCNGDPASNGAASDTYTDAVTIDAATFESLGIKPDKVTIEVVAEAEPTSDTEEKITAGKDIYTTTPVVECTDLDPENDPFKAGAVVYYGQQGLTKLYDTCKVTGPNGILKEQTCDGYHGKETLASELKPKYIKCNCENGACIKDSVVLCTAPEAGVYYPGGSVWTNNEGGKTHISVCQANDESIVEWYYCNNDGTFHVDLEQCDEGIKCGDGMCGGFICIDAELPGSDPDSQIKGTIFLYSPTTGENTTIDDMCHQTPPYTVTYPCPLHTATTLGDATALVLDSYEVIKCETPKTCYQAVCIEDAPKNICEDDDPTNDIHKLGETIFTNNITNDSYELTLEDRCALSVSTDKEGELDVGLELTQYLCEPNGDNFTSVSYSCPDGEGCLDGVCVPIDVSADEWVKQAVSLTCNESDEGKDVLNPGKMILSAGGTISGAIMIDQCVSSTEVKEYYCESGKPYMDIIECPTDHFCVEKDTDYYSYVGACIKCEDSDPEDDVATPGDITDVEGSHVSDFCNSDGWLKQASCNPENGLAVWSDPEKCPDGKVCVEGVCK